MFKSLVEESVALIKRNETESAVSLLVQALDSPSQEHRNLLWSLLSSIYFLRGEMEEAEKALGSGIAEFPDDKKLKLDMLHFYSNTGQCSKYQQLCADLSADQLPPWERAYFKKINSAKPAAGAQQLQ